MNILTQTITRYLTSLESYYAAADELERDGKTVDIVKAYEPAMHALEQWSRPADGIEDAVAALRLADRDYDLGDTPRIPAMIKAALGWLEQEQERRRQPAASIQNMRNFIDQLDAAISLNGALIMATSDAGLTGRSADSLSRLGVVVEEKLLNLRGDLEDANTGGAQNNG